MVHFKDFSLVSPEIQSGDVLKAIEMAIPATSIKQAIAADVPPLRLSFTGTLRVIRRAIPKFQRLQPEELPLFSIG